MRIVVDQIRWQDNPTEECTGWTWTCPQCDARCIDSDETTDAATIAADARCGVCKGGTYTIIERAKQ